MLTLDDIKEWLKTLELKAEHFYVGRLDNKQDKSIGVYQLNTSPPIVNLGGLDYTVYEIKRVTFLVHWNKNFKETEEASMELYKKLQNIQDIKINNKKIFLINLLVDVGTDDNNVFERVIQVEIYYEKKGE